MSQEQVGTRLPGDDYETLQEYCEKRDVSQSEALRRGVRELEERQPGLWDRLWRAELSIAVLMLLLNSMVTVQPVLILAALASPLLITGYMFLTRSRLW